MLVQDGRKVFVEMSVLEDKLEDVGCNNVAENVAKCVTCLKTLMTSFVKKLAKNQRNAAGYIFVVMISPQSRSHKPYALPVQCLPIKGVRDLTVCKLANNIITEMTKRHMKVAGTYIYAVISDYCM